MKEKAEEMKKSNTNGALTIPIRISAENYELLREKSFYERVPMRRLADELLEKG